MILRGITVLTLLLFLIEGVTSLRDVRLLVEPTTVVRGGTAALVCSRDMQGAPLYSVKWYRGNHEFYRYTPMEEPDTRVFGLPGIYVDMNRSNGTQVLLRRLELGLAGNFSCEVTADSPSFATQIATRFIDVIGGKMFTMLWWSVPGCGVESERRRFEADAGVALTQLDCVSAILAQSKDPVCLSPEALPTSTPVLVADKDRYQPGELLSANCTSPPARPPTNLTVYVNEEPISALETSLLSSDSGLFTSRVKVEVPVTSRLFPAGRLRVACYASLYQLYNKSAKLDFLTPETDPRPERITLNGEASTCTSNQLLLLFLLIIPILVKEHCQEPVTRDDDSKQNRIALVGG